MTPVSKYEINMYTAKSQDIRTKYHKINNVKINRKKKKS